MTRISNVQAHYDRWNLHSSGLSCACRCKAHVPLSYFGRQHKDQGQAAACTLRFAVHMTYTLPRLRTILQASHMRFTADRTRMLRGAASTGHVCSTCLTAVTYVHNDALRKVKNAALQSRLDNSADAQPHPTRNDLASIFTCEAYALTSLAGTEVRIDVTVYAAELCGVRQWPVSSSAILLQMQVAEDGRKALFRPQVVGRTTVTPSCNNESNSESAVVPCGAPTSMKFVATCLPTLGPTLGHSGAMEPMVITARALRGSQHLNTSIYMHSERPWSVLVHHSTMFLACRDFSAPQTLPVRPQSSVPRVAL